MTFDVELVGKIGSMALIRSDENDMDYNVFARLGRELRPGMVWVSSGATEIGRLDYIRRAGQELPECEESKADYAAQGQTVLMNTYRQFIPQQYAVRQVLVEHQHFNNPEKREFIRRLLLRAAEQQAVAIVNYNDTVSFEENRRMELTNLRDHLDEPVECVDNDETAATIARLLHARVLLIYSSVKGIYRDPDDPSTLVRHVLGANPDELIANVDELQACCNGASRRGANGASAKLEFIKAPLREGTTVYIAHPKYAIREVLSGEAPSTRFALG